MVINSQPKVLLDTKSALGEGPSWDQRRSRLLWVDIIGQVVHIFNPVTGLDEEIRIGEYVGAVVPCENGDLVVVTQNGFQVLDVGSGQLQKIIDPEPDKIGNRFNDGKCDSLGRFWAGTMNLDQPQVYEGSLYCLHTDYRCETVIRPVGISNGIAWSPEQRTMYYIDTPTKQVVAYDFHLPTGNIRNRRVVITIPDGEGVPDGMTSDDEGMLWVAHWDGWQVSRWDPKTGNKIDSVELPVARVTSCCFGGPNLSDLYITTARTGLNENSLTDQPLAGGLFCVNTGIRGMPTYPFGR